MLNEKGVMIQYFEWYLSNDASLWRKVKSEAKSLSESGFTSIWLPPAYKGQAGINDVGYGVYDLYDLGEFNQKGSIPTKYGTKNEYIEAINELHKNHIQVFADLVFNHMMGADEKETIAAIEEDPNNRNIEISGVEMIDAWTKFTFPKRRGKYSEFTWNKDHFNGVDYDDKRKKSGVYRFVDEEWDSGVDEEKGNYDYLMGANIQFDNNEVVEELIKYGKWYLDTTHVDGFRLDALKHIENEFFENFITVLEKYINKKLFVVGEYWSPYLSALEFYLDRNHNCLSLFDTILHYNFFQACNSNGQFDMREIFKGTLVKSRPMNAVTFVENHDTQAGQALQTVITDWFKPIAYALILLRDEGYPCVFYGDYYGIEKFETKCFKEEIDIMLRIRKQYMHGNRHDYFDHCDIVGWSYETDNTHENMGMAVLVNNGEAGEKKMYVGMDCVNDLYYDCSSHINEEVCIDTEGYGVFKVNGGSYSIYIKKE